MLASGYADVVMKLWLKYAFGIVTGAVLFLALPPSMAKGTAFIAFLNDIALRMGGYAFILTLAAGLPGAVFHLSEARHMNRLAGFAIALFIGSLFATAAIGTMAGLLTVPAPLPLTVEVAAAPAPSVQDLMYSIFPRSVFSVLSLSESWILPLFVFMFAFGLAIAHDPVISRPLIPIIDVVSRASYLINTFIAEVLGILLIPVTLQTLILFRASPIPAEYRRLLAVVLILSFIFFAGLFPLLYRLLGGRKNPYLLLYGMTGPLLAAALSGNLLFAGGTGLKHVAENLGVKRNANSLAFPIAFIAGRAGTALIASVAFISMYLSYSRSGPGLFQVLSIVLAVVLSVLTCASGMNAGIISVISLASVLFGRGFQSGAALLVPVALPLSFAASLLDMEWITYMTMLSAERLGLAETKRPRNFI